MKKVIFSLLLVITFFQSKAQQSLSPQATFSLVTISTGSAEDEIYQIWGHTVLRLKDPINSIDQCYDYGTFDFNKEGFYLKFIRGTLPYQMAIYPFPPFLAHYQFEEKRSGVERTLNLTEKQKNDLYSFLNNNYLPQNREYKYRFFYYNCASRLRDILQQVCGKSLQFSTKVHADSTYRQWIELYSGTKKPWTEFGMDIALGEPSDQKTGYEGAMFLPNNLADAFDAAKIMVNGKLENFVLNKINLTQSEAPSLVEKQWFTPHLFFWILLVLGLLLTYFQWKSPKNSFIFDKILFTSVGLAGWLIAFLWFFTDHGVTSNNLNIIWAFPIVFPVALFIGKKWVAKHFLAYGTLQIILLLTWKFLPQSLHEALIPLVVLLAIRAFFVWWKTRQKLSSF